MPAQKARSSTRCARRRSLSVSRSGARSKPLEVMDRTKVERLADLIQRRSAFDEELGIGEVGGGETVAIMAADDGFESVDARLIEDGAGRECSAFFFRQHDAQAQAGGAAA